MNITIVLSIQYVMIIKFSRYIDRKSRADFLQDIVRGFLLWNFLSVRYNMCVPMYNTYIGTTYNIS